MATVSRDLPERPHLDVPKREARELLHQCRDGDGEAVARVRHRHPKFLNVADDAAIVASLELSDAQLVIAREYGLPSWPALKARIESHDAARALEVAIRADDRNAVVEILQANPQMLHLPVWSGNWGPPMSHAANLGRLDIIKACAKLGARDHQHAFDRAVLQGQIECARWLHDQGAKPTPGSIMGSCETLNVEGFQFLLDAGAPITNETGDPLAPLALVLETYCRNPAGKHAILDLLAARGCDLPDTPIMSLHRGDIAGLEKHLRRDPHLLERRFALREIYPPECGCGNDGRSGMHWTPIDGATLLHLAIDFREQEIFHWLLSRGADVNPRATVDEDGFGGHTPLFNAIVNGPWQDDRFARVLLGRGAARDAQASLRKFLDWIDEPRWHEARNVTAAEWGSGFPHRNWVNAKALELLD